MKYLVLLTLAFSLTLVWQAIDLEKQSKSLKSVEYEQVFKSQPGTTS